MLSACSLFCLLATIATTEQRSFTKMTLERNIAKPLNGSHQRTGPQSDIFQADMEVQKEENEDDAIYSNLNQLAIVGHAEDEAEKEVRAKTENNLEKRKLATGLAILSRGPDRGGAVEQGTVRQKQAKINVGKNRMNSAESSIAASWEQKIPLTKDAMGFRKMPVAYTERAEDDDAINIMPGPGKEILDTLNAWHQRRWDRLLDGYKMRGEYKDEYKDEYEDEYKMSGEGTSGAFKGWEDDTIIRNWPVTPIGEKEKVEEMRVRMEMKMKEMEEKVKLQKEADGFEVPDLGKVRLHNEDEREDMLISLPALGEVRIPSSGGGGEQREQDLRRRRRVFRRQQQQSSPSLKPVKNSQPSIEKPKVTSEVIRDQPMRDLDSMPQSLNGFPRASSSLAMRGLHLLKTALQKRPTISTGLVDRFDPPRTSLLMRGLTMLTTGLQRRPPAVVPPTVVERFHLPPRVRRRPSTLVTLLRLGWEKLTPRLTIR